MQKMAESDLPQSEATVSALQTAFIRAVVREESADTCDGADLEVQAGIGGVEAALFADDLANMYLNYVKFKGWTMKFLDYAENPSNLAFSVQGRGCFKRLQFEAGTHRVQRTPATEKRGRIHTSTAVVSVLPTPTNIEIELVPSEIKQEVMRSSGPGGQHVNTTESAVRLTHLPTGITVYCQEMRSQPQNRARAQQRLKDLLYQRQFQEVEGKRQASRKLQISSRERSDKIRTYNFPQSRVTDHRVKENFFGVADVLAGTSKLDKILDTLEQFSLMERFLEELNSPVGVE